MNKSSLKFSDLKVGLTIFIGLVMLFIFLFLVGTEDNFFSPTYHLKMFVTDVQGLADGSIVTLGGVKVGYVEGFSYAKRNGVNGIIVDLSIPTKYKSRITVGSVAKINSLGLLGDKVVDISMGEPTEVALNDNDFIRVAPSVSFEDITEQIEPAMKNFDVALRNLRILSDSMSYGNGSVGRLMFGQKSINNLESLINNLNVVAGAMAHKEGTIGRLTFDSTLYVNLARISENLEDVTDSLKNGKGTMGRLLSSDSLYNSVNALCYRLNAIVAKANSDSTTVGRVLSDKSLYVSLTSLVKDISTLVKDLKEHPERYVHWSVF
jgi:phospholipid/cholesterol/gamma-HCH transport system substrate-binding protein